jgi:hypothetical protein
MLLEGRCESCGRKLYAFGAEGGEKPWLSCGTCGLSRRDGRLKVWLEESEKWVDVPEGRMAAFTRRPREEDGRT